MKIIEKKIWPKYFNLIIEGKKTFETRLADFEIKAGDILILKEWDPKTKKYTGRKIRKKVTYISNTKNITHWPKEEIEKYGLNIIALGDEE